MRYWLRQLPSKIRFRVVAVGLVCVSAASAMAAPATAPASRPAAVDLYGDPLPAGAIARLGTMRLRMVNAPTSLALSPDGKVLVTVDGSKRATAWDCETGLPLWKINPPAPDIVAFSPAGDVFCAMGQRSPAELRDAATGRQVHVVEQVRGESQATRGLAFSDDGGLLAILETRNTNKTSVRVYDLEQKKTLRTIDWPGKLVGMVVIALSPDGTTLARASDKLVSLFDISTGEAIHEIRVDGVINAMAFADAGRKLLVSTEGRRGASNAHGVAEFTGPMTFVIDPASGRELRVIENFGRPMVTQPEKGSLYGLVYDGVPLSNPQYVLATADIATGNVTRLPIAAGNWGSSVAVSRDGSRLVVLHLPQTIELRRLPDGKPLMFDTPAEAISSLEFLPDGKTLASGESLAAWSRIGWRTVNPPGGDHAIRLWDAKTGRMIKAFDATPPIGNLLKFAPDGSMAAAAVGPPTKVMFWSAADGKAMSAIELPKPPPAIKPAKPVEQPSPKAIAWGRDGRQAICVSSNGMIETIDIGTGRIVGSVRIGMNVSTAAICPRQPVAVVSDGQRVQGVDVVTGTTRRVFVAPRQGRAGEGITVEGMREPIARPGEVAISEDGLAVAAAEVTGRIRVWDAVAGRLVVTSSEGRSGGGPMPMACLAFSPDGWLLASGDGVGRLRIINLLDPQAGATVAAHADRILAVAFSRDSRLMATGCLDATGLVWDVDQLISAHRTVQPPGAAELEGWLSDLGAAEGSTAYRAMRNLVAAGPAGAAAIEAMLSRPAVDVDRVKALSRQLDADDYARREDAAAQLRTMGRNAMDAIQQELERTTSEQAREGLRQTLASLSKPAALDIAAARTDGARAVLAVLRPAATQPATRPAP